MSKLAEARVDGFVQEMQKLALGNVGAAAATGASLLGLGNAYMAYSGSRAQGRGVGESLGQGAKGALVGAGAGAALGGGLAGVSKALRGGQAVGAATPWHHGMDQGIGNFGRRQFHALSGYVPKGMEHGEYVRNIGIGSGASEAVEAAKQRVQQAATGESPYKIPVLSKWRSQRGLQSAEAAKASSDALIDEKVTSLPGLVRGIAGPNRSKVLGAIGRDQWHGTDMLTKAMVVGEANQLGQSALDPNYQDPMGRSRGEAVGSNLGRMAGLLVPSPIPMGGQLVAGALLGEAGAGIGKKFSRAVPRVRQPTQGLVESAGPSYETAMSPAAAGKPFDGSGQ